MSKAAAKLLHSCLITKCQLLSVGIHSDGTLAVDTTSQQFLTQVVEQEPLYGSLHWTSAEVGIVKKEEAQTIESVNMVDTRFDGSLPEFVAAFVRARGITDEEKQAIIKEFDLDK